jgi:SAM-dependent methyltransferase
MSAAIIDLHAWFDTPAGRYLMEWEYAQLDAALADIFGYHALQLGLAPLQALRANRMPHRWMALSESDPAAGQYARPDLRCDFAALPFPSSSLDLVVLPHTLEFSDDPHATLREVERVLVPEGRVVVCGLNPASLWGLRQRRAHLYRRLGWDGLFLPEEGEFIGYWRLRDWMRLLGLEVETGAFGCWRPGVRSQAWLQRLAWMDKLGSRWWPIFGSAYFLVATKRVRGMRLLEAGWKSRTARAGKPATVLSSQRDNAMKETGQ